MQTVFDLLLLVTLALPLALVFTQMPGVRKRPAMIALVGCYVILLVDEVAFWRLGESYYYVHLTIGTLLVSVAACVVSATEGVGERPRRPLAPFYAVWAVGVLAASCYAWFVASARWVSTVIVVLVTVVINGIVLIRYIDDNAVPYLVIVVLWAIRLMVMRLPWPVVQGIVSLLFVSGLSAHILQRARRANAALIAERDFLIKARDIVINMLYDISSSAQSLSSVDYTVLRVLEAITEGLGVEGAAVYTQEQRPGGEIRLRFTHSSGVFWTMQLHGEHGGGKTSFLSSDLRRESYALGEGLVGRVAERGVPIEMDRGHDRVEMRSLGINPHNIRNVLAVPLKVKNTLLGVLVVQNRKHKPAFAPDDIRLLGVLAEQAAISINNARIYEELARADRIRQEMTIASEMQMQLLPKAVPAVNHLSIHPFIRPAKEVGGDYYDFIQVGSGSVAIVIGDVSGKGLPAGMIMIIARTVLQIFARERRDTKDVVVRFAREMYPRMRRGQFMTLNYLVWDDETRTLRYTAAGHEHILWYRKERLRSERIRAGGVAVGLLEDPSAFVAEVTLHMHPGDVFALYTDGITEARNSNGEMFTLNRLQESLDRHASLGNASQVSSKIIEDVREFTGDTEQYDDMTLLVGVVT